MGCAALSRWLEGVPEHVSGTRLRHALKKRRGKSQPSPPSSGVLATPLDTDTETTSKVSTHSSLHRLRNNGCHCCHHPASKTHSHIPQRVNGNCCHCLFLDNTQKTGTQRATWDLIYMALWFPEFLQSILRLQ